MKFFDLHCDTIGECYNKKVLIRKNNFHIDLERAKELGEYTQIFAVWIPDALRGEDAVEYFDEVSDCFYKEIEKNSDLISLYSEEKPTPVKAILSVEGGSACGGTIEGLYHLYEKGARLITLTWNAKNEIGSGAFSEGGLTAFGKEFIKEAESLGIILDVSHLNQQSFFELEKIAEKPFIATHSNADIVNNEYARKRNLTDEQIKVIKERNGIIGFNFCKDFIETEDAKGFDALYRQIEYMHSLDCDDIIAFGSDFDGCQVPSGFCGIEKMPDVYLKLKEKGLGENLLEKLFFENAEKFFSK